MWSHVFPIIQMRNRDPQLTNEIPETSAGEEVMGSGLSLHGSEVSGCWVPVTVHSGENSGRREQARSCAHNARSIKDLSRYTVYLFYLELSFSLKSLCWIYNIPEQTELAAYSFVCLIFYSYSELGFRNKVQNFPLKLLLFFRSLKNRK